jgi:hypothetical protein
MRDASHKRMCASVLIDATLHGVDAHLTIAKDIRSDVSLLRETRQDVRAEIVCGRSGSVAKRDNPCYADALIGVTTGGKPCRRRILNVSVNDGREARSSSKARH